MSESPCWRPLTRQTLEVHQKVVPRDETSFSALMGPHNGCLMQKVRIESVYIYENSAGWNLGGIWVEYVRVLKKKKP
jgi:hypothetical protein